MRGIIFDLDDTLYPYEQFAHGGFMAVARLAQDQHGVARTRAFATLAEAHQCAPGREFQALCRTFRLPYTLIPQFVDAFRHHVPALTAFAGVNDMLSHLRREGCELALLTNGRPEVQARKVSALGLRDRIDHVVYAAEHAPGGKPHADAFLEVTRRLRLLPMQCVMVGNDVECDIRGAQQIGIRTIQVTAEVAGAEADAAVERAGDVAALVRGTLITGRRHVA